MTADASSTLSEIAKQLDEGKGMAKTPTDAVQVANDNRTALHSTGIDGKSGTELGEPKQKLDDPEIVEVDKFTCHVCKSADASVAIVPCRHLCLCLECDPKTDECPVCGGPKTECFYMIIE